MAGEGFFQSKKNVIVALRFLVLASLLVIIQFQEIKNLAGWHIAVTMIILAGSNVWLIVMPRHRFRSQMLYGSVFIADLAVVTLLMIAVAGNNLEFYAVFIPYVGAILYTAWKRKLSSAFLAVLIAGVFYGLLVITGGEASELLSTAFLTWIILFFLTAFFVGYLAEEVGREIEMKEKLESTEKAADIARHELGELRSLHELVTESIPVGLIVIDENSVVEYANPRFAAMLGLVPAAVEGREIGTLPQAHDAGRDQFQSLLARATEKRSAAGPGEFPYKTPQGEKRIILCNIYPIVREDAKLRMVAVLEDVTDKRKAEEERLEKMRVESQFKILSSLSGAISSMGSFRQIISRFASATEPILSFTACATLELNKQPLSMDIHLTAVVGRDFIEQLRERIQLSVTQLVPESPAQMEIGIGLNEQLITEKDSPGMESFLAVPVVVENETLAIIGFGSTTHDAFKPQDISFAYTLANYYSLILSRAGVEEEMLRREVEDQLERERLEMEAARKEVEIEAARKSLEAERVVVRELKRLDGLKSEFITTVSHEMRTPMTSIKSSMDLLLSGRLGEVKKEHKPFIEIAVRNIDRLAQLINDVLNVSRIESGKLKMSPGIYEVKPIVENVLGTLGAEREEVSATVTDEIPDELTAYFDRNSLTQVFTNLVANALNHNEPGVKIKISVVTQENGFLTISVADSGVGVPEGEREKIFERFYQSGRTYGEGSKGTGLGLTISKALVEAMGGTIWLEAVPADEAKPDSGDKGPGADFRFTLPLTSDALAKPGKEPAAASEAEFSSEVLFGKIAVLMKFVTPEQVNECALEQSPQGSDRLGEILLRKGYMTPEQRGIVLEIRKRNLASPSPHDPNKTLADTILGGLALKRGLLREGQLNECLREQALLDAEGKHVLLGEILVKKGYLTIAQILNLLSQQRGDRITPGRPGGSNGQGPDGVEDESGGEGKS